MLVISLTDCPQKLRGDLSKWLFEINTGVYVGTVSARVREELWQRICENLRTGRATMVYSAAGEQKLDFRVHNTTWEPVDFDGIKLMRRPNMQKTEKKSDDTTEKKSSRRMHENCVVIDIETTGLSAEEDEIIELAALRVIEGKPVEEFSTLVRTEKKIPENIQKLTGITEEKINKEGKDILEALQCFLNFVGEERVIAHNAPFDYSFLQKACRINNLADFINPCTDTLLLSRKRVEGVENYKLATVAKSLAVAMSDEMHRALGDCYLTYGVYVKLNEICK